MKFSKIACIVFIATSIIWGCNQDSSVDKKSSENKKSAIEKQAKQPTQPPALQTTPQATPTGEPDKFGRKPGDQHYGHGHE